MRAIVAIVGRVLLWGAVVIVLLVGAGRIVAVATGGSDNSSGANPRVVTRTPAWPDAAARDLAVRFTRDYWTRDPKHPNRYESSVGGYTTDSLSTQIIPTWPRDTRLKTEALTVSDERTLAGDKQRALITVSARVTQDTSAPRTTYLTVPITKDDAGGLVVFDYPSLAAGPARGRDDGDTIEPLDTGEQVEIDGRLTRFFIAYLAGDTIGLEDFTLPGVRLQALSTPLKLRDVGSISLTRPASGKVRDVVVDVTALKGTKDDTTTFPLRYRLRLERGDLWYVAAINQGGS